MTATSLVFVAMDSEAAPYLEHAVAVRDERRIGGALLRDLDLPGGGTVTLVLTGIGFVNAASAATAALLDAGLQEGRSVVRAAVSAGSAGALGEGIAVGDVVVGSESVNLDADARAFGYVLGQTPGMPARYAGDAALLAAAVSVPTAGWSVHTGLVASSDAFTTDEKVAALSPEFGPISACDMETVALAQVCAAFGVPFVAVRGISDFADADAAEVNDANATSASANSLAVTLAVLAS